MTLVADAYHGIATVMQGTAVAARRFKPVSDPADGVTELRFE